MIPRLRFCQTVGEGGVGDRGDGFCRNVDLDVVSVAVETKAMTADDGTSGELVEDEEERTKHRALGDALREGDSGRGTVVDVDKLMSVGEI